MIANGLERVGLVDNVRCSKSDEFADCAIAEWVRIAVNKRLFMAISRHSKGDLLRRLYASAWWSSPLISPWPLTVVEHAVDAFIWVST